MTLKTATIADLLSWQPCYDEAQIREWAGDATEFNALDVLRHPDVSAQDKLWVVLRPKLLDDRTLRLFACDCAERVLHIYERDYPGDSRPRDAIAVARRYANGEATEDELAAARAAAGAAAGDAAGAAAWAAAGDAAGAAAWDAAWDAEKEWQAERLIAILTETAEPA